jgi:hypothetical protein
MGDTITADVLVDVRDDSGIVIFHAGQRVTGKVVIATGVIRKRLPPGSLRVKRWRFYYLTPDQYRKV